MCPPLSLAASDVRGANSCNRHLGESQAEADHEAEDCAKASKRKPADHTPEEREADELSCGLDSAAAYRLSTGAGDEKSRYYSERGRHAPAEDHARNNSQGDERKIGHEDDHHGKRAKPFHGVSLIGSSSTPLDLPG